MQGSAGALRRDGRRLSVGQCVAHLPRGPGRPVRPGPRLSAECTVVSGCGGVKGTVSQLARTSCCWQSAAASSSRTGKNIVVQPLVALLPIHLIVNWDAFHGSADSDCRRSRHAAGVGRERPLASPFASDPQRVKAWGRCQASTLPLSGAGLATAAAGGKRISMQRPPCSPGITLNVAW
jgi:hypothetical protein